MAKFPSFWGDFGHPQDQYKSDEILKTRWGGGFKSGIGFIENNISGLYFNGRAGAYAPKIFEMRLEICPLFYMRSPCTFTKC